MKMHRWIYPKGTRPYAKDAPVPFTKTCRYCGMRGERVGVGDKSTIWRFFFRGELVWQTSPAGKIPPCLTN